MNNISVLDRSGCPWSRPGRRWRSGAKIRLGGERMQAAQESGGDKAVSAACATAWRSNRWC